MLGWVYLRASSLRKRRARLELQSRVRNELQPNMAWLHFACLEYILHDQRNKIVGHKLRRQFHRRPITIRSIYLPGKIWARKCQP